MFSCRLINPYNIFLPAILNFLVSLAYVKCDSLDCPRMFSVINSCVITLNKHCSNFNIRQTNSFSKSGEMSTTLPAAFFSSTRWTRSSYYFSIVFEHQTVGPLRSMQCLPLRYDAEYIPSFPKTTYETQHLQSVLLREAQEYFETKNPKTGE
jgi:hypothetical protein